MTKLARHTYRLCSQIIPIHVGLYLASFLLGMLSVLAFAPFNLAWISILTSAGLFGLLVQTRWTLNPTLVGFMFGVGIFGVGVNWIYVSLHNYGGMSVLFAALATSLFCAVLALFPALFGFLGSRLIRKTQGVWILAPVWVMCEWLRGVLFGGFPWLTFGYTQDFTSPLSGYAPVFGVYGVSFVVAFSAAILVSCVVHPSRTWLRLGFLGSVWAAGWGLQQLDWTLPVGPPVSVSLLQGNVPQDKKWRADEIENTLRNYVQLARTSKSQLIVLPETAVPMFLNEVPPWFNVELTTIAYENGGDIIFGVPEQTPGETNGTAQFNSAVSMGSVPPQRYRKQHLVPLGEFIPFEKQLSWIPEVLQIPMASFSAGTLGQPIMQIGGQGIAVNICFENVFGEEIIGPAADATLLLNLSNLAWFGRSLAPAQFLEISQMRAMENGRYMLLSTNTGPTAIIDEKGRLVKQIAEFKKGALDGTAQGYEGRTPYNFGGNWPILVLLFSLIGMAAVGDVFAWVRTRPGSRVFGPGE